MDRYDHGAGREETWLAEVDVSLDGGRLDEKGVVLGVAYNCAVIVTLAEGCLVVLLDSELMLDGRYPLTT